jgi:hypothetical protein
MERGCVADQPQQLRIAERIGKFKPSRRANALRLIPRCAGHSRAPVK